MSSNASHAPRARRTLAWSGAAVVGALVAATLAPASSGSAATVAPTSQRASSVLSNGTFSSGLSGWSTGSKSTGRLSLTSDGRGGGPAAALTGNAKGNALLRHAPVQRTVAKRDRYRASVWVRTTAPKTRVTLSVAGRPPRTASEMTKSVKLKKVGWRRVSLTYISPRAAKSLAFKVSVEGLRAGGRVLVDDASLVPLSPALVYSNFERVAAGPITPRAFMNSLGGVNDRAYDYDDTSVVATSSKRGRVLRTRLDKGTILSSPAGNNGINVFIPLPRTVSTACVSYDIRFEKKFDWSLGGKLPGLLGVAPGVSPAAPTGGGNAGGLGWSSRMMWLTPKSYSWAGPVNRSVSYLYHPDQSGTYGDNLNWGKGFKAGKWHKVKQCHTMNTVGRYDGRLRAWFGGRKVIDRQSIRYRTRSDVGISHLAWAIFRGGGTLDWAGSRTNHIDIDNVVVY